MNRRWKGMATVPTGRGLHRLEQTEFAAPNRRVASSMHAAWLRNIGGDSMGLRRFKASEDRRFMRDVMRARTWLDDYEDGVEMGWPDEEVSP